MGGEEEGEGQTGGSRRGGRRGVGEGQTGGGRSGGKDRSGRGSNRRRWALLRRKPA